MFKFSYIFLKDAPFRFSVQKWEDGAQKPTVVYHIEVSKKNNISCDCPAGSRFRPCKHQRMLIMWLEKGMPEMFEIADGEV